MTNTSKDGEMIAKVSIVRGKYLDSVKLMLISKELRGLTGIADAVAILATAENRQILAATGMLLAEIEAAAETDIVIVVKADTEAEADAALIQADLLIHSNPGQHKSGTSTPSRSIESGLKKLGSADLCLISIAGKYAAAEAEKALELGLHVLLFSDNVSVADELKLKLLAAEKGLLMMGPDCGTAIINGIPLAFANAIPRGAIGLVSASGTGLQEVSVGIARRGYGVSQAFGTGGRDGRKEIGGIMLSQCLQYLIADPHTRVIVLIAKTPDIQVQNKLWDLIKPCGKPVIVNFLKPLELPPFPHLQSCTSLDGTAALACSALQTVLGEPARETGLPPAVDPLTLDKHKKYIRGLYSGGTLCHEAIQIYFETFGFYPKSNIAQAPEDRLSDVWKSEGDSFIDMGADDFTVGRPHPMIDYSLRLRKIVEEAQDPATAIILLDIVLGYGAHPDPASELVPILTSLPAGLAVVCHVLGTDLDPQVASQQIQAIAQTGARVFTAHHDCVSYALKALAAARGKDE